MVNWESQSKTPFQSPSRVQKTDTFTVFYLFVLHSVTCLKTCHFTACFTSLWTFISVFYFYYCTWCRHGFAYICQTFITLPTHFLHAHTEAHTHKHTCIISTQEAWRWPGTSVWLKGAEEPLLLETKALHTQTKKQKKEGGKREGKKNDIHKSNKKDSSK